MRKGGRLEGFITPGPPTSLTHYALRITHYLPMSIRRIALGLLVSVVSLYFVLRDVDWGQVWAHLTRLNLLLFSVSMLLMLVAYFLMTWRWQHLLDPLEIPGVGNPGVAAAGSVPRRGI